MASRYLVAGGNWTSTSCWSATDGGASGASAPINGDAVFLTATSGSVTLTLDTSARACTSLDCTGFTGTLTMDQALTVAGSVTLASGMTINGSSGLTVNTTATLTSNGKTWPNALSTSGSVTFTFADAWTVTGSLNCSVGSSHNPIYNGTTLTVGGGFAVGTAGTITGTVGVTLNGTGSVTSGGMAIRVNLTINTSGTITWSGTVPFGSATLTYTAGTVTTTGSTLSCATAATLNCSGITWNNVSITGSATHVLSSDLSCSGTLTIGSGGNTTVINGAFTMYCQLLAFANTGGSISGTSSIKQTAAGTISSTMSGTGRSSIPLWLDAPGDTITFTDYCQIDINALKVTAGTTVVSDAGNIAIVSGGTTRPVHPLQQLVIG